MRYKLEQALLNGDLAVTDLPQAWGDELQNLLGIRPRNNREGCLQDIHWYDGMIGYFPTYSLGAMCAAQFKSALDKTEQGQDWSQTLAWLREHIHSKASLLASSKDIMMAVTGEPLSITPFLAHLRARYLS